MNEIKYNLLQEIMTKNERKKKAIAVFKNRTLFIPVAQGKPVVLPEFNKQTWDSALMLQTTGGIIDVVN